METKEKLVRAFMYHCGLGEGVGGAITFFYEKDHADLFIDALKEKGLAIPKSLENACKALNKLYSLDQSLRGSDVLADGAHSMAKVDIDDPDPDDFKSPEEMEVIIKLLKAHNEGISDGDYEIICKAFGLDDNFFKGYDPEELYE